MFDFATGIQSLGQGFFPFIIYFIVGLVLLTAFASIYTAVTPHEELKLVKQNNTPAAISFVGALLGFALPLGYLIAQSVTVFEFLFWGIAAGVVQLLAFFLFRGVFPNISKQIENGEVAAPTALAGMHVVVGFLNAASLTY